MRNVLGVKGGGWTAEMGWDGMGFEMDGCEEGWMQEVKLSMIPLHRLILYRAFYSAFHPILMSPGRVLRDGFGPAAGNLLYPDCWDTKLLPARDVAELSRPEAGGAESSAGCECILSCLSRYQNPYTVVWVSLHLLRIPFQLRAENSTPVCLSPHGMIPPPTN